MVTDAANPQPEHMRILSLIVLTVLPLLLLSCNSNGTDGDYLARVGSQKLTRQEVEETFGTLALRLDSSDALQQVVEGWVKDELIAQEAIRRGLRNDAEVQQLLAENERQVLVSAFITKLFQENSPEPTEEEIEAYYAQNVDQLLLREDYLRVRYLNTTSRARAEEVRTQLIDATVAGSADSLWPSLVERYAIDQEVALTLSSNYYPASLLFTSARLKAEANQLVDNQISGVIEEGDSFHVIQLAQKRIAGTRPELAWIQEEIKQRLMIDARKQMIARQVQRLRTEALAQEDLEIRYLEE